MLRIFTAAVLALSLVGSAAFAQGNTPATNSAPMTTSQPAKADAKTTAIKGKTAHVRHVKHAKHAKHVKHVKHAKPINHVKGVKPSTEKTRG